MKISVSHPGLVEINFQIDGHTKISCQTCCTLKIDLDISGPTRFTANFRPFGIKPLVRVDGFLIDYWLAGVKQQDHKIDLDIDVDFFARYSQKDRQGRLDSLSDEQKQMPHYLDKYIGIDNLYPELVQEIQNLVNEKSNPCQPAKG